MKNKKGNYQDVIETVGIFFLIIIIGFVIFHLHSNFSNSIKANVETNMTQATSFMDSYIDKYSKMQDYAVLFIAIMFPVFSFMAARRIASDPMFAVLGIFVAIIIFIFLMVFANVYGKMSENEKVQEYLADKKIIPFLMPKLLYYGIFYIFLVMIGLYGKPSQEVPL